METRRSLRRSHRSDILSSLVGLVQLGGVVDVVRTVPCEGTDAGSDPVTSTTGHEKSALTRDDKMSVQIL